MPRLKARCGLGLRPTSNRSGSSKCAGSRLALPSRPTTSEPSGMSTPASSVASRGDAGVALHRCVEAQDLVDRRRQERGISGDPRSFVGMTRQHEHRVGDQPCGRLVAAEEQEHAGRQHLGLREPTIGVGGDEPTDQVVLGRVVAAARHLLGEVVVQVLRALLRVPGAVGRREHVEHAQQAVRPLDEALEVRSPHTEHLGDHEHGQPLRQTGDDVVGRPVGQRHQQVACDLLHAGLEVGHRPGGERPGHDAAQSLVVRRVAVEHRRRKEDAVRRRAAEPAAAERLRVVQQGQDVVVAPHHELPGEERVGDDPTGRPHRRVVGIRVSLDRGVEQVERELRRLCHHATSAATDLREHLLAEEPQAVADVLVRHPAHLHDADELVDAQLLVAADPLEDLVGCADEREPVGEALLQRGGLEQRRVLRELVVVLVAVDLASGPRREQGGGVGGVPELGGPTHGAGPVLVLGAEHHPRGSDVVVDERRRPAAADAGSPPCRRAPLPRGPRAGRGRRRGRPRRSRRPARSSTVACRPSRAAGAVTGVAWVARRAVASRSAHPRARGTCGSSTS